MTAPPTPGVTRGFVTDKDRQHHLRRAGTGAPVVLLHRAPYASADLLSNMVGLAGIGTLVAPDLAGYGGSDPLPGAPTIDDYALDVLGLLDRLGLERFPIYGEQLGAKIAARMAALAPDRITALALHDFHPPAAADATPPPLEPRWDGSHLASLWAYLREESCFSPWCERRLANRLIQPMPDAAALQRRLVQLLSAGRQGRGYEVGLRAAASWDSGPDLSGLAMPVWQGKEPLGAFLARHPGDRTVAPFPAARGLAGRLTSRFVDIPGGQLHHRFNNDADTVPLFIQHDAASSTGTVEPIVAALIGRRSVVALDMPGSGESDNLIGEDQPAAVADYADHVAAALDALGLEQIDFYGMWGGGFVGCELALRHPGRIRRLVMSNVFFHEGDELARFQANYTPDVSPVWHGGHLMQCWHQMRDQGLFFPWFDRSAEGIIRREPFLATEVVHERVCSLLKAGNMYRTAYQAHFIYPTFARVAALEIPTLLATTEWDPNRPHTEAVAHASPHCSFQMLDADFSRWGVSFLPFLEV